MKLGQPYRGLIAGLLYPVIFAEDPLGAVEHTMEVVVKPGAMEASPADYVEAIRRGLASSDTLANILPQPHPENVVRAYLEALERRIVSAGLSRPPS